MLRTRIITAVVLLLLFLTIFLILDKTQFAWAMYLVILIAAYEWGRLSFPDSALLVFMFVGFIGAVCLLGLYPFSEYAQVVVTVGAAGWLSVPVFLKHHAGRTTIVPVAPLIGLLVLVPCFLAVVMLRNIVLPQGAMFFLWAMLSMVWAADIGAYFTGKRLGRRKLAPAISPNKTIEGVLGGVVLTQIVAVGFWLSYDAGPALPLLPWLLIALVTGLVSVLGDLLVSQFKRMAGVKDSGWILPGHGGILDRMDGVLAAAPVFTAVLILIEPQLFGLAGA